MQGTIVLFLLHANIARYFYFLVTKGNLTLLFFHKGVNSIRADEILKIKLIYMFAVWEYEEDNRRSISFLKLVKDLMALTLDGRLFHKCAPL